MAAFTMNFNQENGHCSRKHRMSTLGKHRIVYIENRFSLISVINSNYFLSFEDGFVNDKLRATF